MLGVRLLPLVLFAAALAGGRAAEPSGELTLHDPLARAAGPEVVSLPWGELAARLPQLANAAGLHVLGAAGGELPSQRVDRDGDGTPESLLVFTPTAARTTLRVAAGAPAPVASQVGARYAPEHRSDIAWENDRMAFRVYGPGHRDAGHAGGIDVWSKRTRQPVLERWYKTGNQGDYEVDRGEGCDAIKIGTGPGCGATAYLAPDGKVVMSPVFQTWKVVSTGPLRAEVELVYHPVQVGAATIVETRRISYDLGAPTFRIEARFAVTGQADGIRPLAGLKGPATPAPANPRIVTSWFPGDKGTTTNGTIGLGMILAAPAEPVTGPSGEKFFPTAPDLATPAIWHAGATWSKALDSPDPESWLRELTATAARLDAPVGLSPR